MNQAEPKLTKLTKDQEALMEVVRDKWLASGLSTEQSTHEEQRQAVEACYQDADLDVPEYYFFFDSPRAGAIAVAVLQQHEEQYPEDQRDTAPPPTELAEQVQLLAQQHSLPQDIKRRMKKIYEWPNYGQHDAARLSELDYFEQIGVEQCRLDRCLMAAAQHCGWWWPMETMAVITAKPVELHLDDKGELHSTTGMAIKYQDGWGLHVHHGVNVPR